MWTTHPCTLALTKVKAHAISQKSRLRHASWAVRPCRAPSMLFVLADALLVTETKSSGLSLTKQATTGQQMNKTDAPSIE
jgi:hypothetical protein